MTAIYPGSFDPFSIGHLNVLSHAATIFEKVYVVIMQNPTKKRFIDINIMKELIQKTIDEKFHNVEVVIGTSSLIYKEARRLNCNYVVRGIRNNGLDYSYEESLAEFNKDVGNIDTIFIRADINKNVSSTMIRVLLLNNESISKYVPEPINDYLKGCY